MNRLKLLILSLLVFIATSNAAIAGFPCEVVDCHGRKIVLENAPERIVIAGRAGFMITNAAFFFKTAPAKLISYSKSLKLVNNDRFYQMVDPGFATRIFNDFETGIEELAAMKPDIILLRDFERQKYERSLDQLGIRCAFFSLEDPTKYPAEIETLSSIFAEPARGVEIAGFYRAWQQKIVDRLKDAGKKELPRVLHLYHSSKGGAVSFNVAPAHWAQTWLVEQAGGIAVWKEAGIGNGWQQIGFDQIAAWQPEFVTLVAYGGDVSKAKQQLLEDPLWAEMTAVKQHKLFAFPEDFVSWDQPDSRWILGLCWLAAILHPEIPELKSDMHELHRSFFALYGLNADQISDIAVRGDYF
ncbi:MAG: hypothetical protein GQF41_2094 [Candidatus Rifleibacterium amylolyticum]|nr:MAG: hypothetical protein GQF41_2094 [Candidatus Rifleibacterium amylolyticum]